MSYTLKLSNMEYYALKACVKYGVTNLELRVSIGSFGVSELKSALQKIKECESI